MSKKKKVKEHKTSDLAKDIYNCLLKGDSVNGNATPAINELLDSGLAIEEDGKFILNPDIPSNE